MKQRLGYPVKAIARFLGWGRWGWWTGVGAIALLTIHFLTTFFTPSVSATADLDERITALRTGAVLIHVVDATGRSLENAQIHLKQARHYFPFGVSLRTDLFSHNVNQDDQTQYLNIAKTWFNASVPEDALKWYTTEPTQGQVSYADIDHILTWTEQQHLPMRGHHLFWAVEQWHQDWLKMLSATDLREAVERRATEICTRYRGRILEYDVLNEILDGDFFQQRLGDRIINDMFEWCHNADPDAVLYTNEYDILNGEQSDQYHALIRSLLSQDIPLSGIGIQAHIRQTLTPEDIQQNLDRLADLGLPIKITEVSVVADTDEAQAQMLSDLYRVAFAHPAVHGIYLWGFWEGSNWEPRSALFRQNFAPKLAAQTYKDLVYRQWWTDEMGMSDRQGNYLTRAFYGNYQITVEVNGQIKEIDFRLVPDERSTAVIDVVF
jgi:GH35 family endo-1,4-beta-xylanase